MPLIAVLGDPNTHGNGGLDASNNSGKFFVNGRKVVYLGSTAQPDDLCIPLGGAHCAPSATSASSKVFSEGIAVHRHGDSRACGATTVVTNQSKVYVGA